MTVSDLQVGSTQTSTRPSILITSACTNDWKNTTAPEQRGSGPTRTYRPPSRVDPATLGTGLSVKFARLHTLGGGYAMANPVLMQGLMRGDLVHFEMVLGPLNISDSGDAIVLVGFHYGGPTTVTGVAGSGFVGELFRLTAGNFKQVVVTGENSYVGADLYHEGCAETYVRARLSGSEYSSGLTDNLPDTVKIYYNATCMR